MGRRQHLALVSISPRSRVAEEAACRRGPCGAGRREGGARRHVASRGDAWGGPDLPTRTRGHDGAREDSRTSPASGTWRAAGAHVLGSVGRKLTGEQHVLRPRPLALSLAGNSEVVPPAAPRAR